MKNKVLKLLILLLMVTSLASCKTDNDTKQMQSQKTLESSETTETQTAQAEEDNSEQRKELEQEEAPSYPMIVFEVYDLTNMEELFDKALDEGLSQEYIKEQMLVNNSDYSEREKAFTESFTKHLKDKMHYSDVPDNEYSVGYSFNRKDGGENYSLGITLKLDYQGYDVVTLWSTSFFNSLVSDVLETVNNHIEWFAYNYKKPVHLSNIDVMYSLPKNGGGYYDHIAFSVFEDDNSEYKVIRYVERTVDQYLNDSEMSLDSYIKNFYIAADTTYIKYDSYVYEIIGDAYIDEGKTDKALYYYYNYAEGEGAYVDALKARGVYDLGYREYSRVLQDYISAIVNSEEDYNEFKKYFGHSMPVHYGICEWIVEVIRSYMPYSTDEAQKDTYALLYSLYDVDKNGVPELFVGTEYNSGNKDIVDVFTIDNGKATPLVDNSSLGYRAHLNVLGNGMLYISGSGGASIQEQEIYEFNNDGTKLTVAAKFYTDTQNSNYCPDGYTLLTEEKSEWLDDLLEQDVTNELEWTEFYKIEYKLGY